MALVRPIVYVFQDVSNIVVSPSVPSLNTCIVGPCFFIQDTNVAADKLVNGIGDFVKAPYTTADAPCTTGTAVSKGRPSANATIITMTEPPAPLFPTGALVDDASMDVVFDACYLDITHGINGTGLVAATLAAGDTTVVCAGETFTTKIPNTAGVPDYATRVVFSKTDGTGAVVKLVTSVTATNLVVDNIFTSDEITTLGVANILYRVEVLTSDVHVSDSYYTVTGNALAVKTGPLGVLVTLDGVARTVNFATVSIGYRALRTDLTDVLTLESVADIATYLGRIDERNPLAAAANVAFANTTTTLQVFGVSSDDSTGHTDARDKMSSRSDIYCIVPVTDNTTAAVWMSIITMWRTHCEAYAAYTKSKYRIVIGSYPDLPTEKSSAAPSTKGQTSSSAAMTVVDVFVDPSVGADFIGAEVDDTCLLDIAHNGGAAITDTVKDGATIFEGVNAPDIHYDGAQTLYGAIGKKRIRSVASLGSGGAVAVDYAVRSPILLSEGGTPTLTVAGCTWAGVIAVNSRITKPAATAPFAGASVGDVVKVTSSVSHNYGMVITAVDAGFDYIEVSVKEADAGSPIDIEIYTPVSYTFNAVVSGTNTITKTGRFAGAKAGDVAYIFNCNTAAATTDIANKGMYVILTATDDAITVAGTLVNDGGALNPATSTACAVFSTKAGGAQVTCTSRKRLDQLTDTTASFISTIAVAEHIEIPYPADTNVLAWDTTTTQWPVKTIVANQIVIADLDDLEELAPRNFTAGFSDPNFCNYRVNIDLNKTSQATELVSTLSGNESSRLVMVWPNECTVSGLENALTGVVSRHHGQYLACTVGGMICGLPPHQGFTFIGVAGITQIFNSNFYFSDTQIDTLSEGGWYVFLQDTESSAPYSAHEVTTDTSAYKLGELMYVKDFDFIATFYKRIMETYTGRWNITPEALKSIRASFNAGTKYLLTMVYPKIGAPILSSEITVLEQSASETDRVEVYAEVSIPSVLNKIGLHLIG